MIIVMQKCLKKTIKYQNTTMVPFITYLDSKSLLKKMSTCQNNPEKSSTTKINEHRSSGYSLFIHYSVFS